MTLLWSSVNGSERGSSDGTLQNTAAFARPHNQHHDSALHISAAGSEETGTKWSSGIFGMGNPFRPHTRQSPSPSRPSSVVVRRASPSPSASSSAHQHHHDQHDPASPSQHNSSNQPPTYHAPSPASTPGGGDRATKRIKLTVRKPTIASPATRHDAKQDSSASSTTTRRPPTRLTVAEPHGEILQTTNGVRTSLNVTEDGLRTDTSRATTAEPPSQTTTTRKSSDRRSLRSHDEGPRLKSELAVYFPDYEEIIYDAPKEPELFDTNTIIVIHNEPSEIESPVKSKGKTKDKANTDDKDNNRHVTSPRGRAPSSTTMTSPSQDRNRFNGAQVVDFSTIEKSVGHHPKDPLTDSFYFKSHRRAERKEKMLRNIEKERAMHEKAQLERLLDGLQSHDWLRMMGITGVTDAESKKYEPKREYFISEVEALLQKFKTWREEEKRLRQEKEAAAAAEEEDDAEEGAEEESEGENPSSDDFDGAAARQLQMEASGGAKGKGGKGGKGKQRERAPPQPPRPPPPIVYRPPTPDGPFTSFYSKPHLRAAALGKSRQGRNLTAFGHPIPELEEREFALPPDYITPEALKESARRRRRMKRESLVDAEANK